MKKFELRIGGVNYRVYGESLQTVEEWAPIKDDKGNDIGGMPTLWLENIDRIVETDVTEELDNNQIVIQKRQAIDVLLQDPVVLDAIIAQYTGFKAAK